MRTGRRLRPKSESRRRKARSKPSVQIKVESRSLHCQAISLTCAYKRGMVREIMRQFGYRLKRAQDQTRFCCELSALFTARANGFDCRCSRHDKAAQRMWT